MAYDRPPRLSHDLRVLDAALSRRQLLRYLGGAGALALIGCGGGEENAMPDSHTGAGCKRIPEETAGPYPGDGSDGKNALAMAGIVRGDIRRSLGSGLLAAGFPLTVTLTLVGSDNCTPLAGRAVYLWHADRDGNYSMYSTGLTNESYLRGVQISDAAGKVTFTTIFPGCYGDRWPHIHFEVYRDMAAATGGMRPTATSQMAMPAGICDEVYASMGYSESMQDFNHVRIMNDTVFGDGAEDQMAILSGTDAGYAAQLTVGISAS
jgi:protocatechuate 3,4-dioxygenase beta subunit